MEHSSPSRLRPAWIEVDLQQLRRNFQLINQEKAPGVGFISVVKDDAYGHGAEAVAKAAIAAGAFGLAVVTLGEALQLRDQGVTAPILLLGERHDSELPACIEHDLTCCTGERHTVRVLAGLAQAANKVVPVHIKVNTGMSRYGVRWTAAQELIEVVRATAGLRLEGILSHFAMSDELDKTFARLQLERFQTVVSSLDNSSTRILKHICNSGGYLDLPEAHLDLVRLGLLPLGVFPSSVCRRIPGVQSVMTVKARIAAIQQLEPGETVGYGMRYTAPAARRIAVLPLGYGDGYPRIRNEGCVLLRGQRAPLVGGVAMDAIIVDITGVPAAEVWDEVVVLGRQDREEISVEQIAALGKTVSYDVLAGWRNRLPRVYLGAPDL